MPRDGEEVRKRLQWAALELFRARGYEEVTASDIAAEAGVTERTFFRHFPDKRDVLFHGEAAFAESLMTAVRNAPNELGPWDTLRIALISVKHMFLENRPFTEPRQKVIAASPALQERAMAKTRWLVASVTSALSERGLTEAQANLTAWMGVAAMSYGVAAWFKDGSTDLEEHIVSAFQQAHDLSSSGKTGVEPRPRTRTHSGKRKKAKGR